MDALLLLLAALFAPLPDVELPPARPEARIVFAAIPDPTPERGPQCGNAGDPEIYTVAPDGSDLRRVTDNRLHEHTPAWSPDRRQIVFGARPPMNRDPALDADLFVMDADGSNVRRLTRGPKLDGSPAWSPDGSRIAFVRQFPQRPGRSGSDDERATMVVSADGSGLRALSSPRRYAGDLAPAWSPSGTRIVLVRDRGRTSELRAGMPGEPDRVLTGDSRAQLSLPDWSPAGGRIAYTTFRVNRRIEVVSTDGSVRRTITSPRTIDAFSPAWSPAGDRIAYAGSRDGCAVHVFRTAATGGGRKDLLKGLDLDVYSVDW